ncbi:SIR2 family protein [Serratia ficaria]|uniref:SIR2 family protein n=1 Tax=Serratia ficaria TaxID=61651 RepID=UPI00077C9472|nr:SIR2 family protein [Serratia ficaria]
MTNDADIAEQFERHLNSPKQTWLLGAGISFPANIPLMYPLTDRVLHLARTQQFVDDVEAIRALDFIINDCGEGCHIEHHLTHLGDLISISERSYTGGIEIGGERVAKEKLIELHEGIIKTISSTVRWGYKPARKDVNDEIVEEENVGCEGASIVDIAGHRKFIEAVFGTNRAGLDFVRTPVEFFTTNYDTLIEDSLAFSGIDYQDGFTGGGVAFWNMRNYTANSGTRAIVSKLHGSIDWYRPKSGHATLLRVRHGDTYPGPGGSVMIYPQATKYINTQRDPFAEIFQRLRQRLSHGSDHVLLICGYSFGDDHINAEIEIAMGSGKSQLTIVAFADEPNSQLSPTLRSWLSGAWGKRLFIASPKGIYQGQSGPVFPDPQGGRDWWTFEGAAKLLAMGMPKDIQEAIA